MTDHASTALRPPPACVLVVDDDELNCDLLSRRLQRQRYAVDVARDGSSALALINDGAYDLILLDIVMPGLDGLGVLEF